MNLVNRMQSTLPQALSGFEQEYIAVLVALAVGAWIYSQVFSRRRRRSGKKKSWGRQNRIKHGRHNRLRADAQSVIKQAKKSEVVPTDLSQMDPFAFEYLITESYRKRGHEIRKLRKLTGDGGIDGMVHINGRWHIIQAKRYSNKVAKGAIEEFSQLCQQKRMPGLFITTSDFTRGAYNASRSDPRITLISGQQFIDQVLVS